MEILPAVKVHGIGWALQLEYKKALIQKQLPKVTQRYFFVFSINCKYELEQKSLKGHLTLIIIASLNKAKFKLS